jgi:hypothetical protein
MPFRASTIQSSAFFYSGLIWVEEVGGLDTFAVRSRQLVSCRACVLRPSVFRERLDLAY